LRQHNVSPTYLRPYSACLDDVVRRWVGTTHCPRNVYEGKNDHRFFPNRSATWQATSSRPPRQHSKCLSAVTKRCLCGRWPPYTASCVGLIAGRPSALTTPSDKKHRSRARLHLSNKISDGCHLASLDRRSGSDLQEHVSTMPPSAHLFYQIILEQCSGLLP